METEIKAPWPLWTDRDIEEAVFEITYSYRTSKRVIDLATAKLTAMRDGYQKLVNRYYGQDREQRALLYRAYDILDLVQGDDLEAQEVRRDIGEFLHGRKRQ